MVNTKTHNTAFAWVVLQCEIELFCCGRLERGVTYEHCLTCIQWVSNGRRQITKTGSAHDFCRAKSNLHVIHGRDHQAE